jgi:hypothetical protein
MSTTSALTRSMMSLRTQKRTGRLRIDADGTRTFVYLRAGTPIFAEEGSSGETLGRLLVRLKLLSHEQYVAVLSAMTSALVFNEQIRFGEMAVELGYLSEETVHRALQDQVRWKVIRCFQRAEVEWTFDDGEAHVEDVGDFPMLLEALVYQAMLWLDHERRLEVGLRDILDKFVFIPTNQRSSLAARLVDGEDASEMVELLERLNGTKPVFELTSRGEDGAVGAEAALTALLLLGAARFLPSARSVHEAEEPARTPEPPPVRVATSAPPRLDRTRASQVLRLLDSVMRSMKADDLDLFKEPTSEHERRLLAEQACQRGLSHLAAERQSQAHRAFGRAVQLAPENAEYQLLAQFSELSDRLGTDARAVETLKAAATAASKQDPNLAFAPYVLGRCAFATNDFAGAARFMKRALVLDRRLVAAERFLRIANKRLAGP